MKIIKKYSEAEKLNEAFRMLQSAHILNGVQCQNCRYYKSYETMENYKGRCEYSERDTYWNQYCDDFEVQE